MHWILPCALFVAVNSYSVTGNIEVRNSQNSTRQEPMLYDTMNEIQGVCLPDNTNKTANEIKQDTQNIVDYVETYKDIAKLYKQVNDGTEWILKGICENGMVRDCTELQKYESVSGVYKIYPDINVYCDMTTDGGGWTIIQRRQDGSVNFQRKWTEYENGFGNVNGEYWLGNKHIHSLTSSDKYELRIELTDLYNTTKYAVYKTFVVGDAVSKYKLTVGDYSGNAGDKMAHHNDMKFSTTDQDNDQSSGKCVDNYGPWWHKSCCHSGLNKGFKSNLYWGSFSSSSAKTSVMMIRKL